MLRDLRKKIGLLLAGSPVLFCAACSSGPIEGLQGASEMVIGFVIVPLVVLGLAWFLYIAFLKKMLRARHIRVLRERREMREAIQRSRKQ